jgi:hypothetical protein
MPDILRFAFRSIRIVTVIFCICCGCSSKGNAIETWETGNQVFHVRVVAYSERGTGFVPGARYVFTSKSHDTARWHEFMTFKHDDPVPIPREQIRFVTGRIGFVFMGWMYAVTTDGGQYWSVWDARSDLANWECCNYGLINAVTLQSNGTGKMILHPIEGRRGEVPKLCTTDFGRHWTNECD